MRIAVLTNTVNPSTGAGRIASIYNELFQTRGHEVRVFGPANWFERINQTVPVLRLIRHLSDLGVQTKTVDDITSWRPDALLTHNLTGCGFATAKQIKHSGVRWVHVLHDVQLFEPSGRMMVGEASSLPRKMWRWMWSVLRRSVFGFPDVVVSPTHWLLDQHRRFGFFLQESSRVIPNPLRIESVDLCSIERDPKRLIFVGRLDTDKGADLVFDAWPRLRETISELVLVGDGAWRERFASLRDPLIRVLGILPNDEVFRVLVSGGVFISPSRVAENQPTVILEALAAGCRVIASDVGGSGETVGNAGWMMQPGSVDAVINTVRSVVQAQETKEHSTERERILRTHDPDSAVDALLSALTSNE